MPKYIRTPDGEKHSVKQLRSRVSIVPTLLMVLMMGFIFLMSSMNAAESSHLSDFVVRVLRRLIPVFDQLTGDAYEGAMYLLRWLVRKGAHLLEYLLLGGFTLLTFSSFFRWAWYSLPITVAFCFVYAAGDEFHQQFVSGRTMTTVDVMIDTCGAIIGAVLFLLVARPRVYLVMDDDKPGDSKVQ